MRLASLGHGRHQERNVSGATESEDQTDGLVWPIIKFHAFPDGLDSQALKQRLPPQVRKLTASANPSDLFEDIRALIEQAPARTINSAITLLYWQVVQRTERLHEQPAEYDGRLLRRCRNKWSNCCH